MSEKRARPFPPLIDAVMEVRRAAGTWTTDQQRIDANCILEALLAEYGVEAAAEAVKKQGLRGNYLPIIKPLHQEAISRRAAR